MAHGVGGRRRRRAAAVAHENSERWLITYSDLITLLMVFFVVLYSMSRTDAEKFQRISASLERAFNVEVLSGVETGALTGEGSGPSLISPPDDPLTWPDATLAEAARIQARLDAVLSGDSKAPSVSVGPTREGVVVRLSGSFLFDSGRAELKPNALPVLEALAHELRPLPNDVRVDGHTDDIPIDSPRYATNWELSAARALAVVRYLVEDQSIPAARLAAAGYGEFHPLADNTTRENRALNRRVEIHILSSTRGSDPAAVGATSQPTPISGEHS